MKSDTAHLQRLSDEQVGARLAAYNPDGALERAPPLPQWSLRIGPWEFARALPPPIGDSVIDDARFARPPPNAPL